MSIQQAIENIISPLLFYWIPMQYHKRQSVVVDRIVIIDCSNDLIDFNYIQSTFKGRFRENKITVDNQTDKVAYSFLRRGSIVYVGFRNHTIEIGMDIEKMGASKWK